MTLTPAELTVLGLLIEQPRHGYELEQVIEDRGIRQWTDVGFSSIYYLMKKLQSAGLVRSSQAGATTSRRVYSVTSAGRDAAAEATESALAGPDPFRLPVLVGLANLPLLTPARTVAALSGRRDRLAQQIAEVEATRRAQAPLPDHVDAIFELSLRLMQAELGWLDSTTLARGSR